MASRRALTCLSIIAGVCRCSHALQAFAAEHPEPVCGRRTSAPISFQQVEHSKHWAVITTILKLNPAVMDFLDCWKSSRIVVVGDCKTNDTAWRALETPRLVYLSPDDQARLPYKIVQRLPWNHFGRKSIGFMFAIHHGADLIYDFDDDNSIKCDEGSVFHRVVDENRELSVDVVRTRHYLHNPYMWFDPDNGLAGSEWESRFVWPRGFPLAWIEDSETFTDNASVAASKMDRSRVAVYQSLVDFDPDVDAVYRMTRKLPVYFEKKTSAVRVAPAGTFSPWNAQAVMFRSPAFWGMLLPITVTPRVSDIWRSYITTCLMWKTGYHVGFTAPFVTQHRNPHLYMKDYTDEHDLYDKTDGLLGRLAAWLEKGGGKFQSLEEAYVDLIHDLASGPTSFLGPLDGALAEAWAADLKSAGYQWPPLLEEGVKVPLRSPQVVDGRREGNAPRTPLAALVNVARSLAVDGHDAGGHDIGVRAGGRLGVHAGVRGEGPTKPARIPEKAKGKAMGKVAACLLGLPSGAQGVGAAFKKNVGGVLHPEVFIVSPGLSNAVAREFEPHAVDAADVKPEVYLQGLAEKWSAPGTSKDWRAVLRVHGNWMGPVNGDHSSGAYQIMALRQCHDLIEKAEEASGQKYESVLISRLDMMWLLPYPEMKVAEQPGCHIPCESSDFEGYCDHLAYCDRESARTYMLDRTAPIVDEQERRHFIREFPGGLQNCERHVKYVLGRKHVAVHRFFAAAFRACAGDMNRRCGHITDLGMWGKQGGLELGEVLSFWRRRRLAERPNKFR